MLPWQRGRSRHLNWQVYCRGVAKLVKAPDFDSGIRGFESFLPCSTLPEAAADRFGVSGL
jgi:hypothetical protein